MPKKNAPPPTVHHPSHYGGGDNPYEAIKVIVAWKLNFTVKYISRAGKKPGVDDIEDLEKALFYLQYEVNERKRARTKAYKP